jgi:membrane protease YdiL (CAAX protease family)
MRWSDAEAPPEPELPAKTLREEVLVVLSLTLLESAVFALIDLLSGPIEGGYVAAVPQYELAKQLAGFVFGLAPVWLVVYLVRRSGGGVASIGLGGDQPKDDVLHGAALFVVVGLGGIGVYLAAVALGVNRFVVPVAYGHWWTVPVLFLTSIQAALVEEVVVVGYLMARLRQLRWSAAASVAASAVLRGSYHLYQGWGGFLGNMAMGALFGVVFVRTRRVWPLVVAHFLLDLGAGVGFLLFRKHLPGFD